MTIHEYYYTFGFLVLTGTVRTELCEVLKKELLRLTSFREENFTTQKRNEVIEECGYDEDDPLIFDTEKLLIDWFAMENRRNTWAVEYTFQVKRNGITLDFIIREFTHDSHNSDLYYVMGVNIATIDRFKGKVTVFDRDIEPLSMLRDLSEESPEWLNLIKRSGNTNRGNSESGIFVGKDESNYDEYILPEIFCTTDDCDCCS